MVNPAQLGKSSVGLEEQMPHQQISTKVVEMAIAQLKELHLSEYEGRVKEHVSPIRCVKGLGVLQAAELLQAHHLERVFGSKVPDDCAIALKTLKASGFYTSAELASFEHENKIDLKDAAEVCGHLNAIGRCSKEAYLHVLSHSNPVSFVAALVELHKHGLLTQVYELYVFQWKEPYHLAVILGALQDAGMDGLLKTKEVFFNFREQQRDPELLKNVVTLWRLTLVENFPGVAQRTPYIGIGWIDAAFPFVFSVENFNQHSAQRIVEIALGRFLGYVVSRQPGAAPRRE